MTMRRRTSWISKSFQQRRKFAATTEFLPSTDFDQPHFQADQVQRHLDIHFRLIRHDVFGELKDALSGLVLAVENDPSLLEQPRLSLGNIRAQL